MPRGLAPEQPPLGPQSFENLTVSHVRAIEHDAPLSQRFLEPEVRHQGPDHSAAENPAPLAVLGDHEQDVVAVEDLAARIDHDEAIAVAIQGDARIRPVLQHGLAHRARADRPAAVVDVETVRAHSDRHDLRAELLEHAGGDLVGRPVRAVHHEPEPVQHGAPGKRALAELDVPPRRIVHPLHLADAIGCDRLERALECELDRDLRFVGELAAVPGEELHPVIKVRIVRRADHDAGIGAVGLREIGDRGGRGRAEQPHVGSRRGEPRLEGRLEHVAGDAGVLADEDEPVAVVREHPARRPAEAKHEVGGDGMTSDPAPDPVGAEQPRLHPSLTAVSARSPDPRWAPRAACAAGLRPSRPYRCLPGRCRRPGPRAAVALDRP